MVRETPLCDEVANMFANQLSMETKMAIYNDLKSSMSDEARDIMEADSIEAALNQFTVRMFWSVQHRLFTLMNMSDEEIIERIY